MRFGLGGGYANWLTGGAHFFIIGAALQARSASVWPYALAAISIASFAAWILNYRQLRQIEDTPTSHIGSAAQGYVELLGRAEQFAGTPLRSRLTNLPCIWYRYKIEQQYANNKLTVIESGASDEPFLISDGSGQCIIDPDGAEIITSLKKTWRQGDRRYTEWLLLPSYEVYAIGEFATIGGANSELDLDSDISQWLTELKKNRPQLLERFDLNRDGEIDATEWNLARHQARREVEAQYRETQMSDGTNMLRKPADGRLFLISDYPPDKVRRKFLLWCWAHLVICFAAGSAAFALFTLS
jgi:hypothetical protein